MCKKCVIELFPERQRCVMEGGFYQINFLKCFSCGIRDQSSLLSSRGCSQENEEDGIYEESIEFEHMCVQCNHIISTHFYQFKVSPEGHQEFVMSCALCGKGEDFTHARPAATTTSLNVALLNPEPVPAILFSSLTLKTVDPPSQDNEEEENWD